MKKYYLVCDHCGETVGELYTINFNAMESLKSTNFYFPKLELCEDCVDELCELIDGYYNEINKDCNDCEADFEDYEECFDWSASDSENCCVPDLEECTTLEDGEMPRIKEENITLSTTIDKNKDEPEKVVYTEKDLPLEDRQAIANKIREFYKEKTNGNIEKITREMFNWIDTLTEPQKIYATCVACEEFFNSLTF